jgi:hypothetical protein
MCATCGAFHAELPLCFGTQAPYHWELLSAAEQAEQGELTSDLCVIHDASFFVREHLENPIQGTDELFIYRVWIFIG